MLVTPRPQIRAAHQPSAGVHESYPRARTQHGSKSCRALADEFRVWTVLGDETYGHAWCLRGVTAGAWAQDQFGVGIQLSPKWPWGYRLGGKEDFVFGIFGRSECAKGALEHQWARVYPNPNPPACCWICFSGQWIREGPWAALATEEAGCASCCKPRSVM